MRRALVILACLLALAGLAAALHGPAVRWAGRRALQRVSTRIGYEIHVDVMSPRGLVGVELEGVRIGPAAEPLLTARWVRGRLDGRALLRGRVVPERIEVEGPQLVVEGDGTLEGALRDLAARAKRQGGDSPADPGTSTPMKLPEIHVTGGRLVDRAGALELSPIDLSLEGDRVRGVFRGLKPTLEECTFDGRLEGLRPRALEVGCKRPFRVAKARVGSLEVASISVTDDADGRWAQVRGARLGRVDGDRLPAALDGALLDARVRLDGGPARPVEVGLTVPGGARLKAAGTLEGQRLGMRAVYDAVPLAEIHPSIGGTASGHVEARWDFATDAGDLTLDLALSAVRVEHAWLGEGGIGPAELGFSGRIAVETRPVRRVRLTGGRARSGQVVAELEADVAFVADIPRIWGRVGIAPITGKALSTAIPPGLMPNLQSMELGGTAALKIGLDLDPERLEEVVLEIDLDVDDLLVTRLPPDLRLDKLRDRFETHFEMPDGEVITRVTGPRSERWTPLGSMAPLMPIAVLASEDGGFYGHGGVSLKHLRASLIKNLQEGRFARGGSTITMQLARNLFLHRRKTLTRKLEEIVVAWLLERELKKADLLTLYLNVVEFGPGVFGVGDASFHYFGKPPSEMTPIEVAWLVRLLPGPRKYYYQFKKRELSEFYVSWMQQLLDLLLERGHLTPEQHAASDPRTLWSAAPPPLP